jgi:hypothetical protein
VEGLKSTNAQKLLIMQKTKFFKKIIFSFFLLTLSINVNSQSCYYAINIASGGLTCFGGNYYFTDNNNISACGGQAVPLEASGNTLCGNGSPVYWYSTTPNSTGSNYFSYSNKVCVIPSGQTIYIRKDPRLSNQPHYVKLNVCGYPAGKPTITGQINLCSGINMSTYSGASIWSLTPSNAGIITNNNNGTCTIAWSSSFIGTAQLSGQNSTTCCGLSTPSDPLNITINSVPSSPSASNSGITCVGNTLSLSASSITGASYNWTGPNGFTSSQQNPTISDNATLQMAGTYTVTASVNGCSNTPATTNVIINQATINSNSTVCEGGTLSLAASNIPGASYYWTGPNGFSSTSQNPTVSTAATTNMAGTYSVYTTANGCTSPTPGTINIVVTPKPTTPIPSNNGPVCVGNNLSLSVPSITGATYQWTGPNGFTSTIQNPTISTSASALMGGVYNVVTTINGCSSNPGFTTVQINKITSTNNGPVCAGTTLSLAATFITGAAYSWTGPNGFTSSQQNPIVSTNSTSAMAGVYSVTSTVNGCTSPSSVTIASINPSPITPIVTLNTNILHSSSSLGNQWYNQNGIINGAVNQNYTPTVSGNYYVTNTASGCSSTSTVFNFAFLATDEFILNNDLKIYPNPTNSKINIDFGSQFNFIGSQVKLSNILGQEFYNSKINQQKTEITLSLVASKGIYFISIINSEGLMIATKKIIFN